MKSEHTPREAKLLEIIRSAREEIVGDLAALVRIPSVVGEEGAVQQHMKGRLARLGLEIDEFEADPEVISQHRAYVPLPPNYRGRPNVVGTWRGNQERSLILNGHVDVVSPEPVAQWKHNPWGAEIENGKLYGRGAADMKGGVVAALWALEAIRRAGLRPAGQLIFESVIEEEAGGSGGTLACFLRGHRASALLAPEPQSRIAIAHAGVLYFRVRTYGRAAHAGLAHEGVNAVGKLNLLYDELVELDRERGANVHYPPFDQGSGRSCHICVGTYRAGDWPSKVAARAELEARISFIPGETREGIQKLVEQRVRRAAETDPWLREHPPEIEWFGWRADPWEQSAGHPFVGTLQGAVEAIRGGTAELVGKAAAMDTRFAGYFDTAAASYGPEGGNYHGADEYVEIESVVECAQVIALAVARWCGLEG